MIMALKRVSKDKLIGYSIIKHYNDLEMYARDDMTISRCPRCGYRLDFFLTNPDFALKKRYKPIYMKEAVTIKTALSVTYDSQVIVSIHFKEFCEQQGYEGLKFIELPKDPWHFHLIVENIIKLDTKRAHTKFENLCPVCGNYESAYGELDYYDVTEPLADGFYRSDILLGNGDSKGPILLLGVETRKKFKEAALKGIAFDAAYGKEPS
jgi:hypothetical protein